MNEKEKRKNSPYPIRIKLSMLLILALLILLFVFFLRANQKLDLVFLHESENGYIQIYGFSLNSTNKEAVRLSPLVDGDVLAYDVLGDWLVYSLKETGSPETFYRLNIETKELQFIYQCEGNCSYPHFGLSAETIIFVDNEQLWSLEISGTKTLLLDDEVDSSYFYWVTDTVFVFGSESEIDQSWQQYLYDLNAETNLETKNYLWGNDNGFALDFTRDASRYIVASTPNSGMEFYSYYMYTLPDANETVYELPNADFRQPLLEWRPPNEQSFLYSYNPMNPPSDDIIDQLALYDINSDTSQIIWGRRDSLINEIQWNPDGTKIALVINPLRVFEVEGQIWLYDMKSQEAWPLPVSGYAVQWIE